MWGVHFLIALNVVLVSTMVPNVVHRNRPATVREWSARLVLPINPTHKAAAAREQATVFAAQATGRSTIQPKPSADAKPASNELPTGFFLEKEPEGAKSVEDVKAVAKPGDKIAIRGRIGGSATPFVEGRAVFTLVGPGLKACSDNPDDHCKQPWDYCCESSEAIAKHSATIQVVDGGGGPLKLNLKGQKGLKELSEVVVTGTVKEAREKVFIVNATGVYIAKP